MLSIASHQWKGGQLQFNISCNTNDFTWETFPDIKEDHPRATADYMVRNNRTRDLFQPKTSTFSTRALI